MRGVLAGANVTGGLSCKSGQGRVFRPPAKPATRSPDEIVDLCSLIHMMGLKQTRSTPDFRGAGMTSLLVSTPLTLSQSCDNVAADLLAEVGWIAPPVDAFELARQLD